MSDPIQAWQDTVARVCDLIGSLPPSLCEQHVPACPDWTVRDLLSHMVGLGADVLAGDEPDDHNQAWTSAQVQARQARTPQELIAEWQTLAPGLVTWMGAHGSRPLGDVVIHEQDLRAALGGPDEWVGGRDCDGFVIIHDLMAERFARAVAGLPPIALVGDSWSWGPADAPTRLRASDFDLGRALCSRRTAPQLASWVETGDVEAYLDAFAHVAPLPSEPLSE